MAQWVESNSSSIHDIMVPEFQQHIRLAVVSAETASDPLSPSLSAPPLLVLSLSLLKKKIFFKEKEEGEDSESYQVGGKNKLVRCIISSFKASSPH